MKKYIFKSSVLLASAMILSGCSENAWNDHLDGFEGGFDYTGTATVSYTLTGLDYDTIAGALLKIAKTPEEINAAKAIKSNHYFDETSPYPDSIAVPYFLNNSTNFQYIYNNGSVANVYYGMAEGTPSEIAQISGSSTYTLTTENYQNVWGSKANYIEAFSPDHPASLYLPSLLKSQYPNAQAGDYAIVTYNTASENPAFEESLEITDNIKNLSVGSVLNAVAVVTAQCSRGLILTDNGGSILYYNTGVDLSAYPVGTLVKVSGEVSAYNHGLQLSNAATITALDEVEYTYPSPKLYSASMIDAAVAGTTDIPATYVQIQGKLSVSGNYMNVIINGTSVQGSVYYATPELQASLVNDKSYVFTGYFTSFTAKYFYMVVTEATPLVDVELTSNIKDLAVGDNLTATAVVTAQCSRGLILSDNAGSILYYNTGVELSKYPVGTAVKVSGEVSAYNHGLQLSVAATLEPIGLTAFTYPSPTVYTGSMITEAVTGTNDILASYIQMEGSLTISGNYLNIIVDGTEVQGSVYYAVPELLETLESGVSYKFTGYFTSFTAKYLYMVVTDATPVATATSYSLAGTRAADFSPVTTVENAIYYYNGTAWTPAENATVLNPADYSQMGFNNNSLSDPKVYLPLYLKQAFPYAVSGDQKFVAYNLGSNSASCSLCVFDGSAWSLNNNGLENVGAAYTKGNSGWKFTKYLDEVVYALFTGQELELDRNYMLYSNGFAMTALAESYNYGYLPTTEVTESDGLISNSETTDVFFFSTTCESNGTIYNAPEGKFFIVDTYGRYYYLQGTYQSFNVTKTPEAVNGEIPMNYLFYATPGEASGQWVIQNEREPGNISTIYYSSGYGNWAAYGSASEKDFVPYLYLEVEDE